MSVRPPLDLVAAEAVVAAGELGDAVSVSRSWIARAVEEIRAGRVAAAELAREHQVRCMIDRIGGSAA